MRRKLTPRGRQRRAELVAAAGRLFADQGYHPTSVGDIVGALGVGKGVFYWYFTSKDELFVELLRAGHQDLRRRQQRAIGDELDPLRRIELGIRASLAWFDEHRELFTLFQFAQSDDRFTRVMRRGQEVAVGDTARHLKDAIVEWRIPDHDPELLAQAMLGVVDRMARTYLVERRERPEDVADEVVAFCLGGLRG